MKFQCLSVLSISLSPVHCTADISLPGRTLAAVLGWWCNYNVNTEDLCVQSSLRTPWRAAVHGPPSGLLAGNGQWSSCGNDSEWSSNWPQQGDGSQPPHLPAAHSQPHEELSALVPVEELTWSAGNAQLFLCIPPEAVCDEPAACVQATFSCFSGSLQDWFPVWLLSSACTTLLWLWSLPGQYSCYL